MACLLPGAQQLLDSALSSCGTYTIPITDLFDGPDISNVTFSGLPVQIVGSNIVFTVNNGSNSITIDDSCNFLTHDIDFTIAGVEGGIDVGGRTVTTVTGLTANNAGAASANTATLNNALNAAGTYSMVRMPAGVYFFDATINVSRDGQILQGAGGSGIPGAGTASTEMIFLSGGVLTPIVSGILIQGNINPTSYNVTSSSALGSTTFTVSPNPPAGTQFGYITLPNLGSGQDQQMVEITNISGGTITIKEPLLLDIDGTFDFFAYNVGNEVKDAGVENIIFDVRVSDSRVQEIVRIRDAVNCWQRNCESRNVQRFHTFMQRTLHCEVSGNFYNDATNHNNGGQGYGVDMAACTSDLVEDNEAYRLRHSYVLQGGSTGCVLAFNHSFKPIHSSFQPGGPSDMSYHGPSRACLVECNVIERIHVGDASVLGGDHYIVRNVVYVSVLTLQNVDEPVHVWCNRMTSSDFELQNTQMPPIDAEVSNQASYAAIPARWYVSNGPGQPQGTSNYYAQSEFGVWESPGSPAEGLPHDTAGNWAEGLLESGSQLCPTSCYGSSFTCPSSTTGNWLIDGNIPAVQRMQARGLS